MCFNFGYGASWSIGSNVLRQVLATWLIRNHLSMQQGQRLTESFFLLTLEKELQQNKDNSCISTVCLSLLHCKADIYSPLAWLPAIGLKKRQISHFCPLSFSFLYKQSLTGINIQSGLGIGSTTFSNLVTCWTLRRVLSGRFIWIIITKLSAPVE